MATRKLIVLAVITLALVGMAGAANYMYEKASVKGVGYKNVEMIISTQEGFNGAKLVEKESGSGNVITERTEIEAERQLHPNGATTSYGQSVLIPYDCVFPNSCGIDYINFTKEAEFEYMPISYQTGTYDQKWIEKLCVQNYRIGAVLTEMYTHAEHLQKSTEVKTRYYGMDNGSPVLALASANLAATQPGGGSSSAAPGLPPAGGSNPGAGANPGAYHDPSLCAGCCTGVLEANLNSNVIGVAHIGWISRDTSVNSKGRHNEWGRSVEDLTGVFSIEKFIQLWGNSTCGAISVDWLPCV